MFLKDSGNYVTSFIQQLQMEKDSFIVLTLHHVSIKLPGFHLKHSQESSIYSSWFGPCGEVI